MHVIQDIYSNVRGRVWVNGQYSEEFNVGVGVHKGFVLSPLLFILVLGVRSRKFRTCVLWELLYADALVLIADTQEECISKFKAWKAGMENNVSNFLISGVGHDVLKKFGKYPCVVCGNGVGKKSIQFSQGILWLTSSTVPSFSDW